MADYTAPAGISLQNAAGTAINYTVPLTVYDETSFASNVTGPLNSTALPANILARRAGGIVTVSVPFFTGTGNGTAALLSFTAALPTGFQPNSTLYPSSNVLSVMMSAFNNSVTAGQGVAQFFSNGLIRCATFNNLSNVVATYSGGTTASGTGFAGFTASFCS